MLIPLKEYAELNGKSNATARQRAIRGAFKTARKMGSQWVIDSEEPWVDHRTEDLSNRWKDKKEE